MPILNIGSINVDHVYRVPYFVTPGETLFCTEYTRGLGGKGINQSIALHRAGATVHHVGAIGQDDDWCMKQIAASQLQTHWIAPILSDTGHALIQVNPQGENCILLYGGTNHALPQDWVDQALQAHPECNWVLLQNETPPIEVWFAKVLHAGRRLALNPAPCTPDLAKLPLEKLSLLLVNEIEAQQLSACNTPETALDALAKRCPETMLVLTLGAKGMRAAWRGQYFEQTPYPTQVQDTTAAGDTVTGYLLAALDAGQDLPAALDLAAKAAALTVARAGAAASIPYINEI